ncbi:hypothetical protein F2Q70_00002694 [Brassica cretica]|uniref:Uncharacterized protein n=1 Tax=Brassica cretica TaxID=69181 RepID=A0A8S9IPR1_BRACR|nr:hypothetical protein F2Q70_00002694 [Brassica cretica]
MSGHVDTAIPYAVSIGRSWYLPRFLFPESLAGLGEGFSSCSVLSGLTTLGSCCSCALARLATSSSHFTCGQARDRTDGSGDASFGKCNLLLIKAGYLASQGFRPILEDFVETIRDFLQASAADELFYELVTENSGGYGSGG